MAKHIDLKNRIFGRLIVLSRNGRLGNTAAWLCKCICGNEKTIRSGDLLNGHTISCGCYKRERTTKYKNPQEISARAAFRSSRYNNGDLSFEDFFNLSQQNCFYCNAGPSNTFGIYASQGYSAERVEACKWTYNGLDRVNSELPHNKNNVVPCCRICNWMKSNMKLEDFLTHINNLYDNLKKKNII